ncbi:Uncharacterised protein [Mycobacteroides abscessus subsp. abscessus]|nr:Uncharacterised protein [Mycobacteroides abscessus subsp. abscessus]
MSPMTRDPAIASLSSSVSMTRASAFASLLSPVRCSRLPTSVRAASAVHGSPRRNRETSSRE